jgi:hypothetical protein
MVRLTEMEAALAEARRVKAGGKPKAIFVRDCVLASRITLLPEPSHEVIHQLRMIGSNLNQVARAVNSGAAPAHLGQVLEEVLEAVGGYARMLQYGVEESASGSQEDHLNRDGSS